jgi:tRNA A37 threonylcarbamoyladenosine dehydratase
MSERFSGIARLVGVAGLERLRAAHVCVVGIGGVGSWAVEALARSGIGELTLIDLDDVCVSNVNRQLHALDGEMGKFKVDVMAGRARAINPECKVQTLTQFFTAGNANEILAPHYDYVFDAIDNVLNKCILIARCREKGIPVLTAGAGGGRRKAELVRVADLAYASHDRLLQQVRKELRRDHGFSKGGEEEFDVAAIYSPERPSFPQQDGRVCERPDPNSSLTLKCDSGYGTAAFVTGTFGFVGAGYIVNAIANR